VVGSISFGAFLWKVVYYQLDIRWGETENTNNQSNPKENIMN